MIKRALLCIIGVAVLAAAAGTAVVAAAFALYAVLLLPLGAAGAAGCVAAAAAALAALIGLMVMAKSGGRLPTRPEPTLMERATEFARERPAVAAAAALVAGVLAIKNPKLVAGLASAFMAGKAADKATDKSRRRW